MKKNQIKNCSINKKKIQRVFFLIFILIATGWVSDFANPIKGKVVDSNGESVIGASIRI